MKKSWYLPSNSIHLLAHIKFIKTREDNDTKGTVLARHLIQSFLPGEVDL